VSTNIYNIARLLYDSNRPSEAEQFFRRALEIDENRLGQDHPIVAKDLDSLALLLQDTKRFSEAELHSRRAVEILLKFAQSTSYTHSDQKLYINNYRIFLKAMGLRDEQVRQKLESLLAPYRMCLC
jgi:tetratricopeptide (TPR) repeat protein